MRAPACVCVEGWVGVGRVSEMVFRGSGTVSILARAGWCVCVLGAGWGLGWMELRVGSNIMILFSLYIAASHTVRVHYTYIYIVSCHICITFINMLLRFFL